MSRTKKSAPILLDENIEIETKGFTKYEMETSIWYNQEEKIAYISTWNKTLIKILDDYCKKFPKAYQFKNNITYKDNKNKEYIGGKEYTCQKKFVALKKPSTRTLTEEQKAAAGERLKKNLNKKTK